MKNLTLQKLTGVTQQRQIIMGLIASALVWMFLQGFMVVDAATFENAANDTYRASESFGDDSGVVVVSMGIKKVSSAKAGSGNSGTGAEAASSYTQVNTELNRGNYSYVFQVKEASDNSFRADDIFQIQVYGDDGLTATLLATFYMHQVNVEEGQVEGINVTIDLGLTTDISDRYDIIVTRQ